METSDGNESGSSLPDLPAESSHGSSVSSEFINEYDELLKYAIVAPRFTIEQSVYTNKDIIQNEESAIDGLLKESYHEKDVSFKVNPNYKSDLKILEAKKAIEEKSHLSEGVQVNTSDALESLLECSKTPAKQSDVNQEAIMSNNSTPESGVCSPSHVDKGLLRMDSLMDEWCLQLKRNVLAEVVDMKAKQIQNEELALAEYKSKHNMDIKKLTHEVDSLKELIYSFEQSIKQKDEMIENLTDALNKQKEKSDKIRMFSMWRLKLNDEHRQEFTAKMADKFYRKTLCSKVWDGWRSIVENKWKARVEKACQIKSQEVCLKLTEDYEERLQGLQKELAGARADVSHLHTERECYEENMKKAFMRGVCALNMEAMTMFREGGPDENNASQQQHLHHPCTGPPFTGHVDQHTEKLQNFNNVQSEETSHPDLTKKHVTFNTQPLYDCSNIISNKNNSSNIPNKNNSKVINSKSLHVKMTGKKENAFNTKKEKACKSSRPSSISSIKVERHIPHDIAQQRPTTQQGPLKSNFNKKDESATDVSASKKSLPRAVKVVD